MANVGLLKQSRRYPLLITAEGRHEPRPLFEAVDTVWGHLLIDKQQLSVQQIYEDMHFKGVVTELTGWVSLRKEQCSKWPWHAATEAPASHGATANTPGQVGRIRFPGPTWAHRIGI